MAPRVPASPGAGFFPVSFRGVFAPGGFFGAEAARMLPPGREGLLAFSFSLGEVGVGGGLGAGGGLGRGVLAGDAASLLGVGATSRTLVSARREWRSGVHTDLSTLQALPLAS